MKTNINKRYLTAAVCLMVCVTAFAQAQSDSSDRVLLSSCPSVWTSYSNPREEYSFVRSNATNHVVYIREKEKVDGRVIHTFIVRRTDLSEVAFSTSFLPQPFLSVEILDMRLYEDTCYFCGKYIIHLRDSIVREPRTRGFVGRFVTTEMIGDSGSVKYYIVDSAYLLTRLAISQGNGSPLLISAIGEAYPSGKDCIVEMKNGGALGWKRIYDIVYTADNLIFSDIMKMGDSLTLLAQYSCINDNPPGSVDYDHNHQVFLLDRFNLMGCKATHGSVPCYMALYSLPVVQDYYFHHDRAPMRLFHIQDKKNKFGVAFGVEEENGFNSGIRLFKFQHAWEYYSSLYYRAGTNTEIKEIGNHYKTDTLYVLSKDNANPNGLITVPSMGIGFYPVTFLWHYAYTFNSLTQKFAGNHIDISGHNNTFNLHLFDQDVYSLSSPSCFQIYTREYEPLSKGHAEGHRVVWGYSEERSFGWTTAEINKIQIEKTTVCEKCN